MPFEMVSASPPELWLIGRIHFNQSDQYLVAYLSIASRKKGALTRPIIDGPANTKISSYGSVSLREAQEEMHAGSLPKSSGAELLTVLPGFNGYLKHLRQPSLVA